ncbi:MAG: ATP-binding cassette domain-containing protein [Alphaproteobacteria bacterium]
MTNINTIQKPSNDFQNVAAAKPLEFISVFRESNALGPRIVAVDMTINRPNDRALLAYDVNFDIRKGQTVGFTGPNGSGKSTLFRAFRDVHTEGSGDTFVISAPETDIFFASQEIRKFPASLPHIMAYPKLFTEFSHEEYEQALRDAELEEIIIHLPWHAAQPENLKELVTPFLDRQLSEIVQFVDRSNLDSVISGFEKVLRTNFKAPVSLTGHLDPSKHDQLCDMLIEHGQKVLSENIEGEKSRLFRPRALGKNIGKTFVENATSIIERWLLHGERMTLSGGQQQRLLFARAFMHAKNTSIFMMDEPTSALKGDTAHLMMGKLMEKRNPDSIVIAIVHDNSLLEHFSHHLELHSDKTMTLRELDKKSVAPRVEPPPTANL